MSEWIVIFALFIAVLVVVVLIMTFILISRKKEGKAGEINYKIFFIIGLTWIPIGGVFMITINFVMGIAFMGLGIAYMAVGLAHRDKWEKKGE